MSWTSSFAVFFILWWLVLFTVLPFGIRNSHETGDQVVPGSESGAPVRHGMVWKTTLTTVIAGVIFALLYIVLTGGALESLELPFIPDVKV